MHSVLPPKIINIGFCFLALAFSGGGPETSGGHLH